MEQVVEFYTMTQQKKRSVAHCLRQRLCNTFGGCQSNTACDHDGYWQKSVVMVQFCTENVNRSNAANLAIEKATKLFAKEEKAVNPPKKFIDKSPNTHNRQDNRMVVVGPEGLEPPTKPL